MRSHDIEYNIIFYLLFS